METQTETACTTVVIDDRNFKNHKSEIAELLDSNGQKLAICWSSSGPLENIKYGGFNKFTVEKNDRPIFFLESCYDQHDSFLRIFPIKDSFNKVWDGEFSKDAEYFSHIGPSRYFSNSVSKKLDGRFFEANDNKYLRFEIWEKNLNPANFKKLGRLLEKFLREAENRGYKSDYQHLVHTLLLKFIK